MEDSLQASNGYQMFSFEGQQPVEEESNFFSTIEQLINSYNGKIEPEANVQNFDQIIKQKDSQEVYSQLMKEFSDPEEEKFDINQFQQDLVGIEDSGESITNHDGSPMDFGTNGNGEKLSLIT